MGARYILAPQAALDLLEIWRYLKEQTTVAVADRVESAIRERVAVLAATPGAGHFRKDLTDANVRFFTVSSHLIIYRPDKTPLQIVSILHGRRDLEQILTNRL